MLHFLRVLYYMATDKTKVKARNFAFIIYPESIPEDWEDSLSKLGVPMAVSPLHDLDETERKFEDMSENEKAIVRNGGKVFKKPHYHVLYIARNPVTAESVRIKVKRALGNNSISHIEIVDSVEYYFQYLTHESSDAIKKNKHKYDKKDIRYINDFDIDRYVTLDVEDKDDMLNDVCDLIDDHNLANMRELRRFVKLHGVEYGLPSMKIINSVLRAHTGLIRLYFDAVYQERRYGRADIDKDTGEVLNNK